ncbi:hypothetical protein H8K90_16020 [Winogradskyella echinorum]|uniref:Uncharacterized protein n=1 Tax=Winogradskyella echinorum TaxID=538189 RepID=A0ABR6Y5A0_9FLAO|nr:hypothetical protein [Winogradskyella echinorum]MBC3847903.1 hypothetical protein [Winogradskyella echinorum]MBC5752251.1 hypothetical protein [Winogradskyella echinorum]
MKKNIGKLILLFALIFSQYNFSQNSDEIKTFETQDGKTIKLLPNNRVLFEVSEKISYPDSTNVIRTTNDGKKICGLRISYLLHQSYGFYRYDGQNIVLTFQDENPIEKIDINTTDTKINEQQTLVRVKKEFDTFFDLKVYQEDKELCNILSFGESCNFTIEDTKKPLVLDYNGNLKTIKLNLDKEIEIIVSINDLKGNNQIKNESLVYNISELIEK